MDRDAQFSGEIFSFPFERGREVERGPEILSRIQVVGFGECGGRGVMIYEENLSKCKRE